MWIVWPTTTAGLATTLTGVVFVVGGVILAILPYVFG